jgi:hypothetical protein
LLKDFEQLRELNIGLALLNTLIFISLYNDQNHMIICTCDLKFGFLNRLVVNTLVAKIIHSDVRKNFSSTNDPLPGDHGNRHHTKFQGQSTIPKSGKEEQKSGNEEHLCKHQKTTLCIKNMVSIRCKLVVKAVLKRLELHFSHLELGRVDITDHFPPKKRDELKGELLKYGLELLDDQRAMLVERIKNVIVEMVHYKHELPKVKFSVYLCEKLNNEFSYTYLSTLFSEVKGITIEHYIIIHRIERAKEMMVYNNELTISEIAWQLHFSSVAHLSTQFKEITGLTPSHFKHMKHKRLTALEDL